MSIRSQLTKTMADTGLTQIFMDLKIIIGVTPKAAKRFAENAKVRLTKENKYDLMRYICTDLLRVWPGGNRRGTLGVSSMDDVNVTVYVASAANNDNKAILAMAEDELEEIERNSIIDDLERLHESGVRTYRNNQLN